jgi:hypothetical protein
MSAGRIGTLLALVVLACGWEASAQGLGERAAKERQKREQAKKQPAKVFTNDDLDAGRPPGSKPTGSGGESAAPTPGGLDEERSSAPEVDRVTEERGFIDAIRNAEHEVNATEARIRELQAKLNPMSTSYIYGSPTGGGANEEQRVRAELRDAEDELQAARQALLTANQNLQGFRQGRPRRPLEER